MAAEIAVVFATETGTAEEAAGRACRLLASAGYPCQKASIADFRFGQERLVVFFVATTGEGQAPRAMQSFWRFLLQRRHGPGLLGGKRVAIFGLGDSSYILFNGAARKLARRLQQVGGTAVVEVGEGDDQHPLGYDGAFLPWIEKLKGALEGAGLARSAPPDTAGPSVRLEGTDGPSSSAPEPTNARMAAFERLTADDHFQDVRHVVLQTDAPTPFTPGDIAVVAPHHGPEAVEELLGLLGWSGLADTAVRVRPLRSDVQDLARFDGLTLRDLFTRHLDIVRPTRRLLEVLADHTASPRYREKLAELASPEGTEALLDYIHRPRRTVAEVLRDFAPLAPALPADFVFDLFAPIRPRCFSIAGGGSANGQGELHLCVALVRFKTILPVERVGLCSQHLARAGGARLQVAVQPGALGIPAVPSVPLLLVATGTGIAPIRAIIRANPHRRMVLLYGCRRLAADFLYGEEWARFPALTVVARGSRDSSPRWYVDATIREQRSLVLDLLESEAAIVVGGHTRLRHLVRRTLADLFGAPVVTALESAHRLLFETWS